ncbi:MAG: hypothetical protein IPK98_07225 [Chloracidobacterium sp.]|nr:hypothetical protein [Chloracidobacterium sp.]
MTALLDPKREGASSEVEVVEAKPKAKKEAAAPAEATEEKPKVKKEAKPKAEKAPKAEKEAPAVEATEEATDNE